MDPELAASAPATPLSFASHMAAMSLAPDTDLRDRNGCSGAYSCNEFLSQGPTEPIGAYLVRLIHMVSIFPACTGTLYANGYTFESALTIDRDELLLGFGDDRKTPALPFSHTSAAAMTIALDTILLDDGATPIRRFLQTAESCAAQWWQAVMVRNALGEYVHPEMCTAALGQQLLWMRYFGRSFLSINGSGPGLYFVVVHGCAKRRDCTIGVRMSNELRASNDPVYAEKCSIVSLLDGSMRSICASLAQLPPPQGATYITDAIVMRVQELCALHLNGVRTGRYNPNFYEAGSRASDKPPRHMRFGLDDAKIAAPEPFENGVALVRATMVQNIAFASGIIERMYATTATRHPFYTGRTLGTPACDVENYLRAWANRVRNTQILTTFKKNHSTTERPLESGMYAELVHWVRDQGSDWRLLFPIVMDSRQTRPLFRALTSAQIVAAGFVECAEDCARLSPPLPIPSQAEIDAENQLLDRTVSGARRKVSGRGVNMPFVAPVSRGKRHCTEPSAAAAPVPGDASQLAAIYSPPCGSSFDESSCDYTAPVSTVQTPFVPYCSPMPIVHPLVQLQAESARELQERRAVAVRLDSRIRAVATDPAFAGRACLQVFYDMAKHGTPFYAAATNPHFLQQLNAILSQHVPAEQAYLIPTIAKHLTSRGSLDRLLKTCDLRELAPKLGHGAFHFSGEAARPLQARFDDVAAMFECDAERDILMAWQLGETRVADVRRALLEDAKQTLDSHLILAAIGSIASCSSVEVGPSNLPFDPLVAIKLIWPVLNWAFLKVSHTWIEQWPSYLSDQTTRECGSLPIQHFVDLWQELEKQEAAASLSASANFAGPECVTRHDLLAVDPSLQPSHYCIPVPPVATPFIPSTAHNPFLAYDFDPSGTDGINYAALFAAMTPSSAATH